MKTLRSNGTEKPAAGFTRTELVVVIALVGLLGIMVLPALAGNRANSLVLQCLDNQRRLAAGWITYASDHDDTLMANPAWVDTGAGLSWAEPYSPALNYYFDKSGFVDPNRSPMAAYVKSAEVYKCPAENFKLPDYPTSRNRSVSLNAALSSAGGGGTVINHGPMGDRTYYGTGGLGTGSPAKKMSDLNLPGPAMTYLFLDEHPDSINDAVFSFNPGASLLEEKWRDLPAALHEGGAGISFADGHAVMHRWQEIGDPNKNLRATTYPVLLKTYTVGGTPWSSVSLQASLDYEWLDERTPYQNR